MANPTAQQVQDQVLSAMKQSQDATVQAISLWGEAVDKLASRLPDLPDLPKLPLADALPKPGELSEQLFDFAQQVLRQQQEFVQQVVAALPGHDKRG